MNVNLEAYRVFCAVARLGSFSRAADELFISQPAVSQAIQKLEEALGGALFVRVPKAVRLTPEGEVLYECVRRGIEWIGRGEAKFRALLELETGEIRIGASDMTLQFYLLPHLEAFHSRYPNIRVKVTNAPTPDTVAHLRAGRIDFGVVTAPIYDGHLPVYDGQAGGDGAGGIRVTPVSQVEDVFVAGARFDSLRDRTVRFGELAQLPIVMLEQNTSTRHYVDLFLKENGVVLSPEFELATSDLIVKFAARGLGVGCVVRDFALPLLESGELFLLRLEKPIPKRDLCIISAELPVSPAGKKFLELLPV